MIPTSDAQVLYHPPIDELRFLPEGPYPCGDGMISWVAIQHGADQQVGSLNLFNLRTRTNQSFTLPGRPGFAFPLSDYHRFVVGCERTVGIYDTRTGAWEPIVEGIDSHVTGTIINDGVTWDGNLVFGCKDLKFAEAKAGLYLWRGRDKKLFQLAADQTCSNGKAVVRIDGNACLLYDIDTPTKTVVSYRLDLGLGRLTEKHQVLDLRACSDFPDGMIMTADQKSLIISFYNPNPAAFGETRQYRIEDGKLERVWRTVGSPQATCPQLVEWEGKIRMIITTAVEHMPKERQGDSPNAGCLFVAETDFTQASEAPVFTGIE